MRRTSQEWIRAYEDQHALWIHDGNPKRPHARLRSEKHSSGFFYSGLVVDDEPLLYDAASDLVDLYVAAGGSTDTIDRVVGPKTGATKLAEAIANEIGRRRSRPCAWASPAKQGEGAGWTMVFDDPDHQVLSGEVVLSVEDVITTGTSVDLAANVSVQAGGDVVRFILVLVNRSGLKEVNGRKIVALIDREMPTWEPAECPLCHQGSEAIYAKGDNWTFLTAQY